MSPWKALALAFILGLLMGFWIGVDLVLLVAVAS